MPSTYLQSADYAEYGVPAATAQQVRQASILIDAYLLRQHGLIYTADANGNPCFMSAMTPELTLTGVGAFGPGNGLTVRANGPLGMLQVGESVVLDRANPASMEVVQITGIDTAAGTVLLGSTAANQPSGVQFAHADGCTMETGLVITEKRYLPKNRSEVMLSYPPIARIVGGTGRYAYGRRGDAAGFDMNSFNLLASLNKFGGPPAWEIWPANTAAGVDAATGQLWVPAGIMLAYYSEVKVRYVAGFQYSNLPSEIKLACAQIIQAMINNPQLGDVSAYKAGDTSVSQLSSSILSQDVKSMLQPWRARAFA